MASEGSSEDPERRRTTPVTWFVCGLALVGLWGAVLWWTGRLDDRLATHRGEPASAERDAERHAAALATWEADIVAQVDERLAELDPHEREVAARLGDPSEPSLDLARWLDRRLLTRRLERRLATWDRGEYVPSAYAIRAFAADGSRLDGGIGAIERVDPDDVTLTITPGDRGRLVGDLDVVVRSPDHVVRVRARFLYRDSRDRRAWLFDSAELRVLPD